MKSRNYPQGKKLFKNMEMVLKLDKKQFKELLLDVMVGVFVRGGVADVDEKYIKERNGRFPERIFQFYNKYEKEFEKHGIERLEIKDDK